MKIMNWQKQYFEDLLANVKENTQNKKKSFEDFRNSRRIRGRYFNGRNVRCNKYQNDMIIYTMPQ